MIRVLWLIKGLGPGGAEQLLVNQARVCDHDAFEFEAAYLVPWKDHLVEPLRSLGIPVTCLDDEHEADLRWAARLRRLVVDRRFDVVHAHSPYVAGIARLALRTLPARRRPLVVYTEHNQWPRHARASRMLNRLTMPLDDLDLAVSDDVRTSMSPALAARTKVLDHGVDVERVRSERQQRGSVRDELDLPENAVVVGIVANFRREKAYEVWLDAARLALDVMPSLRFVSVGQGPLETEMRERLAAMSMGDRVRLLGYRDDAVRVMSAFDIFTLTSRHEGLPVTLMDALVLGLPIVATDVGGIREAVVSGVEGLLVPTGDSAGLAEAYVQLASDPALRQRMGVAASQRGLEYDVRVTQWRLEETYRRLVARTRS